MVDAQKVAGTKSGSLKTYPSPLFMENTTNADNQPTPEGIRYFEEQFRLITINQPQRLASVNDEINRIKAMFVLGNRRGLLNQLTRTAPNRYVESGLETGVARILNAVASLALCCLQTNLQEQGLLQTLTYPSQQRPGRPIKTLGRQNRREILAQQEAALGQIRAALKIDQVQE